MNNKLILLSLVIGPLFNFQALAHDEESDGQTTHLSPIQVLGDYDQSDLFNIVPTVTNLMGDELFKKSKSSLGETLSNEVGVNSTQFGPTASRPVIRGMEGNRIRILQNGIGVLDVSGASQDHAVPTSPLAADSIEIVRGPINLLYGSSAIGGVVNLVNSRIHHQYSKGVSGGVDVKGDSVNESRNLSTRFDYGVNRWMLHFDGNVAKSELLSVPYNQKIVNSQSQQNSVAVGATFVTPSADYYGLSFSNYKSNYGTVAESDVIIDMNQQRFDLESGWRMNGFIKDIHLKSAQSFYHHDEIESGELATTFKNAGNETRLELIQNNKNNLSGILGLQFDKTKFSALGEEAFVPITNNLSTALFAFEELKQNNIKYNIGLRGEYNQIEALAGPLYLTDQNKNFFNTSIAFGVHYSITANLSTTFNASLNERAPTYQELYAKGAHVATGIHEIGDQDLGKEKSFALEWSLRKQSKSFTGTFTVFDQRFNNYIALNPTGAFDDHDNSGTPGDSADDFPIYNYVAQNADIYGAELSLLFKLASRFDLKLQGDYLRGKNTQSGTNLPRISPARLGASLIYNLERITTSLETKHVLGQHDLATNETPTDAYTLLNFSLDYQLSQQPQWTLYTQVNNIFDVEARNHVSIIKDKMQLGGRNIVLGIRSYF
jgi:iron complex outermembrane recepter protein